MKKPLAPDCIKLSLRFSSRGGVGPLRAFSTVTNKGVYMTPDEAEEQLEWFVTATKRAIDEARKALAEVKP